MLECPSGRVQQIVQTPVWLNNVLGEGRPLVPVSDDLEHWPVVHPLIERLPQRSGLVIKMITKISHHFSDLEVRVSS